MSEEFECGYKETFLKCPGDKCFWSRICSRKETYDEAGLQEQEHPGDYYDQYGVEY